MRPLVQATLAVLLLTAVPALAQTPVANRLTMEDFLNAEAPKDFFRGGGPEISPDGKLVAYSRWWIDKMTDRWKQSIWLVIADGARNRWLVDAGGQRWSPDGTRLAYVTLGEPTGAQIFVRYMDAEGSVTQVTRLESGPSRIDTGADPPPSAPPPRWPRRVCPGWRCSTWIVPPPSR